MAPGCVGLVVDRLPAAGPPARSLLGEVRRRGRARPEGRSKAPNERADGEHRAKTRKAARSVERSSSVMMRSRASSAIYGAPVVMGTPLCHRRAVTIPADELTWTATRSSGAGGQNVNKVSSRVELRFDLEDTRALVPAVVERLRNLAKQRARRRGKHPREERPDARPAEEPGRRAGEAARAGPGRRWWCRRRAARPSRRAARRRGNEEARKDKRLARLTDRRETSSPPRALQRNERSARNCRKGCAARARKRLLRCGAPTAAAWQFIRPLRTRRSRPNAQPLEPTRSGCDWPMPVRLRVVVLGEDVRVVDPGRLIEVAGADLVEDVDVEHQAGRELGAEGVALALDRPRPGPDAGSWCTSRCRRRSTRATRQGRRRPSRRGTSGILSSRLRTSARSTATRYIGIDVQGGLLGGRLVGVAEDVRVVGHLGEAGSDGGTERAQVGDAHRLVVDLELHREALHRAEGVLVRRGVVLPRTCCRCRCSARTGSSAELERPALRRLVAVRVASDEEVTAIVHGPGVGSPGEDGDGERRNADSERSGSYEMANQRRLRRRANTRAAPATSAEPPAPVGSSGDIERAEAAPRLASIAAVAVEEVRHLLRPLADHVGAVEGGESADVAIASVAATPMTYSTLSSRGSRWWRWWRCCRWRPRRGRRACRRC